MGRGESLGQQRVSEILSMLQENREALEDIMHELPEELVRYLTSKDCIENCLLKFDELDSNIRSVFIVYHF